MWNRAHGSRDRGETGSISLSWTGTGTLEQTASFTPANWQPAANQDNPQTISTTDAMKF
jgi:hypothetical protein